MYGGTLGGDALYVLSLRYFQHIMGDCPFYSHIPEDFFPKNIRLRTSVASNRNLRQLEFFRFLHFRGKAAPGLFLPNQTQLPALRHTVHKNPFHIFRSQLQKPQFFVFQQILGNKEYHAPPALLVFSPISLYPYACHAKPAVRQCKQPWILQAFGIQRAILILCGLYKQHTTVMIQRLELLPVLADSQMHTVRKPGAVQHSVFHGFSCII